MTQVDLALDLGLVPNTPRAGRQADPTTVVFERELTEADLAMPAVRPQRASSIKSLRDGHHALARVLATGSSEAEASLVTGYSGSRISILKADPQFQELLDYYRSQSIEVVADMRARMASLGLDALAELRDRLEEAPDDFSAALLKDIVKEMADRTGHAPQRGPASVMQVNVQLGDRMARARERVEAAQLTAPKTIDAE